MRVQGNTNRKTNKGFGGPVLFILEGGMILGQVEMGSGQFLLHARAQFLCLRRANFALLPMS